MAMQHLKNAHLLVKNDEEVLIQMGELEKDINLSLEYFKGACSTMESKKMKIPFELLNNIGALEIKIGQFDDGYEHLMKALSTTESTIEDFSSEHICIVFNISGCLERKNLAEAKEIYKRIVKKHPHYIEAFLRLAQIALDENKMNEAVQWCEIAQKIRPKDPSAWTFLGTIYLKKKEWSKAQEMFENVIKNIDKNDFFSNLSLGHLYFSFAKPELKDKEERNLSYSTAYFQRILQQDTSNVYAATGLGAIIATQGYIENAKEILLKCREFSAEIPEVWINLAHISVCNKEYHQAVKLYENCSKKFFENKNIQILTFIAKTHYLAGELTESKTILQKALKLDPTNQQIWYNLGIIHHDLCVSLLKNKSVTDAQLALENIKTSHSFFKYISSKANQFTNLKKLLETTKELQKEATENVTKQHQREKKIDEQRKQQEAAVLQEIENRKEKKLEEERKKKEMEELKIQRALETQKKFEDIQKTWITESPSPQPKQSKSTKKKKTQSQNEEENGEEAPPQEEDEEPEYQNEDDEVEFKPINDQLEGEEEINFDEEVATTPKKKPKKLKQKRKRNNQEPEDQEKVEGGETTPKKKSKK
jgi:RNA polymerase-associated protein CTR9